MQQRLKNEENLIIRTVGLEEVDKLSELSDFIESPSPQEVHYFRHLWEIKIVGECNAKSAKGYKSD